MVTLKMPPMEAIGRANSISLLRRVEITLPETNKQLAPENEGPPGSLEIPIGNTMFRGELLVLGCVNKFLAKPELKV